MKFFLSIFEQIHGLLINKCYIDYNDIEYDECIILEWITFWLIWSLHRTQVQYQFIDSGTMHLYNTQVENPKCWIYVI